MIDLNYQEIFNSYKSNIWSTNIEIRLRKEKDSNLIKKASENLSLIHQLSIIFHRNFKRLAKYHNSSTQPMPKDGELSCFLLLKLRKPK